MQEEVEVEEEEAGTTLRGVECEVVDMGMGQGRVLAPMTPAPTVAALVVLPDMPASLLPMLAWV